MNERMSGLITYLDRLIALEDTSYNCRREIDECIAAVREELDLVPLTESGAYLGEGDRIEIRREDGIHIVDGPANVTFEVGGFPSFERRLDVRMKQSGERG